MTYSDILRSFYTITLEPNAAKMADIFFTSGCLHWQLAERSETLYHKKFHRHRLQGHVSQMKKIIRECGDFSNATDPSGGLLHIAKSWVGTHLPHNDIFLSMPSQGYMPGD